MNSYLSIVSKYLSAHKKKTRLVITSVVIAVALVTSIFSMLDIFIRFEKIQLIHEYGNFHLGVKDATDKEKKAIANRIDVKNSGMWISFRNGNINGKECELAAVDEKFSPNMNITILEGKFPVAENELILEAWAAESLHLNVGDMTEITFADNTEKKFIVSGIYSDYGDTKAKSVPGIFLSVAGANKAKAEKSTVFLIEFKDDVNINNAQKAIQSSLKLADNRIVRNEYLLSVMGYGNNNPVRRLYATGAVLFCIVLIAGVMMIYNTFNISVMERVQQFGLLRCIGASQSQIKKLVKREGLHITLRAIPIGVLAGMLLAFLCSVILKYYNSSLFGEMPLFNFSIVGIIAGIAIGAITVFIASSLPAKKAAGVSPVNAVNGSSEIKISQKKKQGRLTKIFRVEVAMGINNAVVKKKTLFLMSCSIAISIVMFLGFQVYVDFMYSSLKTTKPYTPDISLTSEQGLSSNLYKKLSNLSGVKKVYGRMFSYVDATFDASRLTDAYKEIIGDVQTTDNGLFIPPEKSWLISYDKNQLNWAKTDLIEGKISEEKLNEKKGIIAVARTRRNGVGIETAKLQLGDKVYIQTPDGTKEMTVMAILRTVPFNDSKSSLTTFITTEKLFTELTGESTLRIIDIQLDRSGQEQTVSEIKGMLDDSISFYDQRQKNAEVNGYFLTMAVFIYGFVAVIALISVLNIINTMNTSVASKTRYLGVMRAVGMSSAQLDKMVLAEALTYSLIGGIVGCIMGIALQKMLINTFLPRLLLIWKFPYMQIVLILIILLLVTVISIISPLKWIKAKGISEVIGSL
ncbi:ABC transporter permease [Calorimonas adulescens]|uniref:FtsX-like permease family protein n=1 Tax=Calorimonas adulescens TaxID=2606906 RepID=A0A5D8QDJ3_9THEO|nr:FtsX-like permease family protein [Calorimonas adulescens]TZE81896.1 FtsX-like permease family protein [Calorimonas adulescens]